MSERWDSQKLSSATPGGQTVTKRPIPALTPEIAERFWAKVKKHPGNGCWEWTGCIGANGYGQLNVDRYARPTHRLSYTWFRGEIMPGYVICHMCDNPKCVRPEHLFSSTSAHNNVETYAKGRRPRLSGEKNVRAKLTMAQVREIREAYEMTDVRTDELAAECGVALSVIHDVVAYKTYPDDEA